MKKLCIALLVTVITKDLPAQISYYVNPPLASDNIFNFPPPGSARSRFDFILPRNNRMIIEVNNIKQLQQLPDLDSLFKKIWADLAPLRDSLANPLQVRRVDYVPSQTDTKIRIKQYTPSATYFSYKDDELVQMKVDQDTIRYRGYTPLFTPVIISGETRYISQNYVIMLLLNNIADAARLPDGLLQSGLSLLIKDIGKSLALPKNKINAGYFYAMYNVQQQKRVSPLSPEHLAYGKKHGLQPYVQVGIQYARNAWIPSVGAGLEYFYGKDKYGQLSFRLIWEPYFLFRQDAAKKLVTERNDFITLKFHENYKSGTNSTVEFVQNFSFGYLVHRKGDWFAPTTFKFSLPGLQTKNVLLEPEFFFNKFFKNFSPSLKLAVYFE